MSTIYIIVDLKRVFGLSVLTIATIWKLKNGKPNYPTLIGKWAITIGHNKCGTIYIIVLFQKDP